MQHACSSSLILEHPSQTINRFIHLSTNFIVEREQRVATRQGVKQENGNKRVQKLNGRETNNKLHIS